MMTRSASLPGIDRRLDLADHLGARDDLLPLVMAAFLRRDLVLDMKPGDPGFLVLAHGADDIDRVAVAGIGVGDDRDRYRLDRQPDKADIFDHRQQPEIGVAAGARVAAAGQVNRGEPGLLDKPRRQRVVGARHHRIAASGDQPPQRLARVHAISSPRDWIEATCASCQALSRVGTDSSASVRAGCRNAVPARGPRRRARDTGRHCRDRR